MVKLITTMHSLSLPSTPESRQILDFSKAFDTVSPLKSPEHKVKYLVLLHFREKYMLSLAFHKEQHQSLWSSCVTSMTYQQPLDLVRRRLPIIPNNTHIQ